METLLQTAAFVFAPPAAGDVPEFVHLLPAGTFTGVDGRGPFLIDDADRLIAGSMTPGRKLPIDINHAIDHLSSEGKDTPAVGWIVSLETRDDGIWGRVEWTERGRALVAGKAYGFVSPVFTHTTKEPRRVLQLLRASLCNDPNLILTALHTRHQKELEMNKQLREALGLAADADDNAVLDGVRTALNTSTTVAAGLSKIALAAGLAATADADAIVTAINARKGDATTIEALESQVTALNTRLTEVTTATAQKEAERVVDAAITAGKIVPALRDRYIARHVKEPAEVEAEIKLLPSLNSGGLAGRRDLDNPDNEGLSDTDLAVCQQMGLDPKAFAAQAKAISKELN